MCCSESHFPAWQTFTYLVIRIIDIGCNARSTLIRENFPGKLFRRTRRQCCIRAQIYPHQQRCYYGSRQYGALVLHIVHELNSGHCCRCSQHNRPDQTGNWRNNWPAFTICGRLFECESFYCRWYDVSGGTWNRLYAVNEIAPEHVELLLSDCETALAQLTNAGAVFADAYSSEPVGTISAEPTIFSPHAALPDSLQVCP